MAPIMEVHCYEADSPTSTDSLGTPSSHLSTSSQPATPPTPTTPPSPVLPPCRVCSQKASGFHYGVNTCEACKGFFRRSLKRKDEYRCLNNGSCSVGDGKRNSCPRCRYKKCLQVGMSKDAIKTGRYTHEKRTQDIQEVNRLKQHESSPIVESVFPIDSELKNTVDLLTTADRLYNGASATLFADNVQLIKAQQICNEKFELEKQVFGSLSTISKEDYQNFYQTTGIDLDDRQELMRSVAKKMEQGIMRFINFAKSIPGFTELSLDDQANLVKASRFEFWYFGAFCGINPDLNIIASSNGEAYHVEEIGRLWDIEFVKELIHFSRSIKRLNLVPQELSIIRGVVVTFADRCTLQNPEKVDNIQWQLVKCLQYVLAANHPQNKKLFFQVFDRLTAIRSLSEWNQQLAKTIKLEWPVLAETPLLLEILTI